MSLGLKHALGRNIQFTMYVGSDILQQLSGPAQVNKTKSNMFGRGYEAGRRASYGCSYRGRAWSHNRADNIEDWVTWCREVSSKLTDESITTEAALKFALIPIAVTERPNVVPLSVLWPEEFLIRPEDAVEFHIAGKAVTLVDTAIELVGHTSTGPIRFRVSSGDVSATYEITFSEGGTAFRPLDEEVDVVRGARKTPLSELFKETPPDINFADGSFLVGNAFFRLRGDYRVPFLKESITVMDWSGVDLRKESQKDTKRKDSIQRRVIESLLAQSPPPAIVFDDDDSGEVADIIALREEDDRLSVDLYHCKFSTEETPGARIDDLYAVCGQAQTSVSWRSDLRRLLEHIERREASRLKAGRPSRFEQGSRDTIRDYRSRLDALSPHFTVWVVQPGLSRSKAGPGHLELFAVTQHYLHDTFGVPLRVLASE
jgi:hypothetical protein